MVSHRLRSISSVFGGKNSKEIAGDFGARCPFDTGGVTSVMAHELHLIRMGVGLGCSALK